MRFFSFTLLLVVFHVGCASSHRGNAQSPLTANWKTKNLHVHFQAGPQGPEGGSYSFYEITHTTADDQQRSLVMESAHTTGGFSCVTNGVPKKWIRVIEDPSGKALLIEEEIPNDCGPCSNYLWVRLDSNGFIEGTYLLLPSMTTGDHGGINYEYPHVLSLEGQVLRYRYSTGDTVKQRIESIDKADRPTPPG